MISTSGGRHQPGKPGRHQSTHQPSYATIAARFTKLNKGSLGTCTVTMALNILFVGLLKIQYVKLACKIMPREIDCLHT